jgi:hypothetical protein
VPVDPWLETDRENLDPDTGFLIHHASACRRFPEEVLHALHGLFLLEWLVSAVDAMTSVSCLSELTASSLQYLIFLTLASLAIRQQYH